MILAAVLSVVYALLHWWAVWDGSVGFYSPTPYFTSIIIGTVVAFVITWFSEGRPNYGDPPTPNRATLPSLVVIAALSVYAGWTRLINTTTLWNFDHKAALIGEVEVISDLNAVMEPTDTAHICLVDVQMATVKAQEALSKFKTSDGSIPGSRYEIGTPTKQFINRQLWWIFPVEFHGYWKWKEDEQVPGYLRVSAEDPYATGEAVQKDSKGEDLHIKYLNSASREFIGERHLRNNGYMNEILNDWTFEPDDSWRPYYTVTVAERTIGYSGLRAKAVVVLDLQTGEFKEYPIGEQVPAWVDRSIPLEFIDYNVEYWGEFNQQTWWDVVLHDDKSQEQTPGWYLTYDEENGAQWFTGLTSSNKGDSAMTGFLLINARSMKASLYKANGVTESRAYDAARSMWSNFEGYEPCELVPYNIDGELVYVVPMQFKGQFKGVSLVSLNNVSVTGKGKTLAQALQDYRMGRSKAKDKRVAPGGSGMTMTITVTGKISRLGMLYNSSDGSTSLIPFMLEDAPKRFEVFNSTENAEVVFMKVGDHVTCTYLDNGEHIITCSELDIQEIHLTDTNPAQQRLDQNQVQVKKDVDRTEGERKRDTLLKSDRLDKVDPEALEEFLRSQQKAEAPEE
ncbi:MAG TPA: hypothetical protein DCZ47_00105 [Candidatus Magasanikbacteria bacterium]|nr:hypothetical protein [Candidatus Magasanikbacteria bacterium]